jgi:L-rhamnose mutarotase
MKVFIADRSPFSAALYARSHGSLLPPLVEQHLAELSTQAGVHVYTVHVSVERQMLWERIQKRLAREPIREVGRPDGKNGFDD